MFDCKTLFLLFVVGIGASISAMNQDDLARARWITKRAAELGKEPDDTQFLQEKSNALHSNQLMIRGGLTAFWGYVFHKETKKIGSAVIKAVLFMLSLWWLIKEYKNPSKYDKTDFRSFHSYMGETRGVGWEIRQAEREWEKRQQAKGAQQ